MKRYVLCRRFNLLALVFCALSRLGTVSSAADDISTLTIDRGSGGLTGQYTSQAVVNGNPAIASLMLRNQA